MRTSSSFGPTTRTAESAKSAKSRLSAELALNLGLPFANVSSSQPPLLLHLDIITANMGQGTSCPRVMDKGILSKNGRAIRTQSARLWLESSALTANSATQPATSTGNPPTIRDCIGSLLTVGTKSCNRFLDRLAVRSSVWSHPHHLAGNEAFRRPRDQGRNELKDRRKE